MKLTIPALLFAIGALAAPAHAQTLDASGTRDLTFTTQSQGEKEKVDVTGAWAFTIETGGGTGTPSVTFKQDGEKLTGHYSSQVLGERDFTGTIKGNAINFTVEADIQGQAVKVIYSGTVEKDTMKGKVVLGDLGEGTFTGKRK